MVFKNGQRFNRPIALRRWYEGDLGEGKMIYFAKDKKLKIVKHPLISGLSSGGTKNCLSGSNLCKDTKECLKRSHPVLA